MGTADERSSGDLGEGAVIPGSPLDRFEVVRELPRTGPGRSLLAEAPDGEHVVLKHLAVADVPEHVLAQQEQQTEIATDPGSPIVLVRDVLHPSDEEVVLVRPHVDGVTLAEFVPDEGLPVEDALELALTLLDALEAADAMGLQVRNIKPTNVVVPQDGTVTDARVVDLGLEARSRDAETTTREARYVAPEQAGLVDHPVDASTDLYRVGLLLHRALTGSDAVTGSDLGDVLRTHVSQEPPRIRSLGREVPRAVDCTLHRLLQSEPQARYRSVEGLRQDLQLTLQRLREHEADPQVVTGARDLRQSLVEPGFVGRHQELTTLFETVQAAREGAGSLVEVAAESGGGKTRLLQQFRQEREGAHAAFFVGGARDQVAQRPFATLRGVIHDMAQRVDGDPRERERLREALGPHLDAACEAFPSLGDALDVDSARDLGPEDHGETRTLEALTVLLDALGDEEQPAVVVLDDVQWADALTLKLLVHWHRHPPAEDRWTTVVVAYRSDEVGPDFPLRGLQGTTRLMLPHLEEPQLRWITRSMAGPIPVEAEDLVVDLAAGNPFMATAMLRGIVEAGALEPGEAGWELQEEHLQEVQLADDAFQMLHRRLQLLTREERRLLTAGAVLGKEFIVEDAAALAEIELDDARRHVEATEHRRILWTTGVEDEVGFTHDKLREALLERLDEEERRDLHLRAARRYRSSSQDRRYELAYHYDAAGKPERALPHALPAAQEARDRYALETAIRYYRIAERGVPESNVETRFLVAEGLGDVLMLDGRYEEAAEVLQRAADLADDDLTRAGVKAKQGELAFKRGDVEGSSEALEEGQRLLGERVPTTKLGFLLAATWEILIQLLHTVLPSVLVHRREGPIPEDEELSIRIYSRMAHTYWFQRGAIPTLFAHLREMNLAERYPPSLPLAQAYSEHAPVCTMIPLFHRGHEYGQRSLRIRRDHEDLWGEGQSLHFLGTVLYAWGRFEETLDTCRKAVRILERTGDRWEATTARWHIAFSHHRLGNLQRAVEVAQANVQEGLEIGDRQARGISLGVWSKASGGKVPGALLDAELEEPNDDVHTSAELAMAQGIRLLDRGEPKEAVRVLQEAQDLVEDRGLRQEYVAPVRPWLATAVRATVESLDHWQVAEREDWMTRARAAVDDALAIARWYPNNRAHAHREAGLVAALDGRGDDAREHFATSLESARELDMAYEDALTREARGRVGASLGWSGAEAELRQARRDVQQLRGDLATQDETSLNLVDRFASLLETGRSIITALDPDGIRQGTLEAARDLLRAETALLLEPSTEAPGWVPARGDVDATWSPSLVREAAGTGRPRTYDDRNPGDAPEDLVASNLRSALCAPVQVHGETKLVVWVGHENVAGLFRETETQLAGFLAALASAALENARNFRDLRSLNETLEERVRTRTQDLRAHARELQRANADLRQFAYVASHDLQEPLRTVGSYVDLLERKYRNALDDDAEAYMDYIRHGVRRMKSLIQDLLAYSRIGREDVHVEEVDLDETLDAVLHDLDEQLGDDARVTRGDLPTVRAVPSHIHHVLQNLVSNGLKFQDDPPREVHVDAERRGDAWEIRVEDNGIGIDPKHTDKIFSIFQRLHTQDAYPGTGIGLAICKKLLEAHGGTIDVVSQEGRGATFWFTVPDDVELSLGQAGLSARDVEL